MDVFKGDTIIDNKTGKRYTVTDEMQSNNGNVRAVGCEGELHWFNIVTSDITLELYQYFVVSSVPDSGVAMEFSGKRHRHKDDALKEAKDAAKIHENLMFGIIKERVLYHGKE